MESWEGCEFLELESYVAPLQKHFTLPMQIIEQCVDPIHLVNIQTKDCEYIEKLAEDIRQNGLQEPGLITIAGNGVTLSDGNHRFCAFLLLQKTDFPVILRRVDGRIKQGGIPHQILVEQLLEYIYG